MPIIWDFAEQQDHNDYDMIDELRRTARRREHYRGAAQFCVMVGVAIVIAVFFSGLYQIGAWIAEAWK